MMDIAWYQTLRIPCMFVQNAFPPDMKIDQIHSNNVNMSPQMNRSNKPGFLGWVFDVREKGSLPGGIINASGLLILLFWVVVASKDSIPYHKQVEVTGGNGVCRQESSGNNHKHTTTTTTSQDGDVTHNLWALSCSLPLSLSLSKKKTQV